jgi:hypothetical protein
VIVARILALAAIVTLAGCQAFWDLPSQMREPYGSSGSPPHPIQDQAKQTQDEEESLP